ncbi:MAG: hypothetical protein JO000_24500 [Alphaproteobacteria bacterium]|nr:hypothetical protein [Alphaproteobacteria bacterium]
MRGFDVIGNVSLASRAEHLRCTKLSLPFPIRAMQHLTPSAAHFRASRAARGGAGVGLITEPKNAASDSSRMADLTIPAS